VDERLRMEGRRGLGVKVRVRMREKERYEGDMNGWLRTRR
jgi:hypothetical protein